MSKESSLFMLHFYEIILHFRAFLGSSAHPQTSVNLLADVRYVLPPCIILLLQIMILPLKSESHEAVFTRLR